MKRPQYNSQLINTVNPSLDLSKYKFIPPSKILKTQGAKSQHHQSMKEPERAEQGAPADDSTSPLKINRNFNKKRINKQNQHETNKGTSDSQINTSASQHRLKHDCSPTKVNPAYSFLFSTHKQLQKCKTEYYDSAAEGRGGNSNNNSNQHLQAHIKKLNQYISEIKAEAEMYGCRTDKLTQQNKSLQLKIQQYEKILMDKNKVIVDLNKKTKEYEQQAKQKCHEHTLIIESLSNHVEQVEKIIESQKTKISELEIKVENLNLYEDSRLTDDYNANQLYNKQKYDRSCWSQRYGGRNNKSTTPDFGTGTPEGESIVKNQELSECSAEEQPVEGIGRSSLSKIEQSVEQSYTSEQQSQHVEQHQELLNEIDKYLSKWNQRQ